MLEITNIFKILRKYILFVILIPLLTTSIGTFYTFNFQKDIYSTSTLLYVSALKDYNMNASTINPSAVIMERRLSIEVVQAYSVFCKTEKVLQKVIDSLGLKSDPKQLAGKITVSPEGETEFIRITTTDTNPQMAADLANSLADIFELEVPNVMKMDNVQVIDKASVPNHPSGPNRPINIIVSALFGFILVSLIIFLLESFDNTIKSSHDLEVLFDKPVIGNIPKISAFQYSKNNSTNKNKERKL